MDVFRPQPTGAVPDNADLLRIKQQAGLTARPLSSNNPFRNRADSPALVFAAAADQPFSPALSLTGVPPRPASARPLSRNPFLSPTEAQSPPLVVVEDDRASTYSNSYDFTASLSGTVSPFGLVSSPVARPASSSQLARPTSYVAAEPNLMLDRLSLSSNQSPSQSTLSPFEDPQPQRRTASSQSSKMMSEERRRPHHHPSSRGMRTENNNNSSSSNGGLAPPPPYKHRSPGSSRPRRNSESSVLDSRPPNQKPRSSRHESSRRHRTVKPKGYDTIDQLDVTGLYGSSLVHHDGPFDACNPHRNKNKSSRAPMAAFPVDSTNNSLAGGGFAKPDHNHVFGTNDDAWSMYNQEQKIRPQEIDPLSRIEPIHGVQTHGLGTSTFLEGTPASLTAIRQHEGEDGAGGLQRKKSLAQRFRGMSQGRTAARPDFWVDGRAPPMPSTSNSPRRGDARSPVADPEAAAFNRAAKSYQQEGRESPSSSQRPDAVNEPAMSPKESGAGGFLNRVKSLKGGKRKS